MNDLKKRTCIGVIPTRNEACAIQIAWEGSGPLDWPAKNLRLFSDQSPSTSKNIGTDKRHANTPEKTHVMHIFTSVGCLFARTLGTKRNVKTRAGRRITLVMRLK